MKFGYKINFLFLVSISKASPTLQELTTGQNGALSENSSMSKSNLDQRAFSDKGSSETDPNNLYYKLSKLYYSNKEYSGIIEPRSTTNTMNGFYSESKSKHCKGRFSDIEHYYLASGFTEVFNNFTRLDDRTVTVSRQVDREIDQICLVMRTFGCTSIEKLRYLTLEVWTYSIANKCAYNVRNSTLDPSCRCSLVYSSGNDCPFPGIYWS